MSFVSTFRQIERARDSSDPVLFNNNRVIFFNINDAIWIKFIITASIRDELHWLTVLQRYHYKLWLVVYKSLHRSALSYLIDQCELVSNDASRERLRSALHDYLICPRTELVRYGDHSFGA